MHSEIAALFLDASLRKLEQMHKHVETCLEKLEPQQIWLREAEHENTVGNLILHLCGNMRQWIMHGVGGAPDIRKRDEEFAASGGYTAGQLAQLFSSHLQEASAVIAAVLPERLTERIRPQNMDTTVLGAIYQVVGHVQMHVGQIIVITKRLTARDLDLTLPRPR